MVDTHERKPEAEGPIHELHLPFSSALRWMSALETKQPERPHQEIARAALGFELEGTPPEELQVVELASEFRARLVEAKPVLSLSQVTLEEVLSPPEEDGMLWLDARAARYLETLGAKEDAGDLRSASQKRFLAWRATREQAGREGGPCPEPPTGLWRLWWDPSLEEQGLCTLRFALQLARVLWRERVKPRLEREARLKTPAAAQGVLTLLNDSHFRKERRLLPWEGGYTLLAKDIDREREVACIERTKLEEIARRYKCPVIEVDLAGIIKATRTLAAQRVLRDLTLQGFRQKVAKKEDYRSIVVVGGLKEYTRQLGMDPDKMMGTVRDILDALELVSIPLPHGGHDGLLKWSNRLAVGRARGEVQIVLMDPLLPGYMFSMPETTASQRLDRRPVPIPERLPPTVGSPQFHAAEAVLQLLTLREFSRHAEELYGEGTVGILEPQWCRLADEAEVPRRLLPDLREAWKKGEGTEAPAFLTSPAGNRYALADPYAKEREMILETGQWVQKSGERGKAAAKSRWTKTNQGKKKR